MPCIPINPGGFICCNHSGRLHLGSKYIWVEFHKYTGPTFYRDAAWRDEYIPVGEHDPIWPLFYAWLERRKLV